MTRNELLKKIHGLRASSPPAVAWNTYASAMLASQVDGLEATVPFVLGISAGFSLIQSSQVLASPFAPASDEEKQFAAGVRYAFSVDTWNKNQQPDLRDILNSLFGGAP